METEPPFRITENADLVITGTMIEKAGKGAADGVECERSAGR